MVASSVGGAVAPRAGTIAGGFVLIPVAALIAAWRASRARPLGPGDFRAYLACREILARRRLIALDRAPSYDHAELGRLLGVTPKRARASTRRLVAAGLLRWSDSEIGFPEPPAGPGGPADQVVADSIGSGRGDLAIPRRLLRDLVQGGRPALIATALGALLRCLSRRKAGFDGRGRLKASWVAQAFGVGLRAVKAARAELIAVGWIAPEASSQAALNRWGRAYRIDLGWAGPAPAAGRVSPPPRADGGPVSPPPDLDQEPLPGVQKNQEPTSGGPAGFKHGGMGGCEGPTAVTSARARPEAERAALGGVGAAVPTPRLEDVRPEDLCDAGRLIELHRQAAVRGLVGTSEADRLKFVAAAEHARVVGKANPCGLFARIVAKGWWHFATLGEEERAARRLREGTRGPKADRTVTAGPGPERGPSSLGAVLGRLGIGGGPMGRDAPGTGAKGRPGAPEVPGLGARDRPSRGRYPVDGPAATEREIGGVAETEMLARLARLIGGPPA